tara:strand:- start:1413 stop:1796 length:384 start_codon:yes stop_codon:yes gene_type:complete
VLVIDPPAGFKRLKTQQLRCAHAAIASLSRVRLAGRDSSFCGSQPDLAIVARSRFGQAEIYARQCPAKSHSFWCMAVPATFQLCQFLPEDWHIDHDDWSPVTLILTVCHLAASWSAIDAENGLSRLR